jgi:hypothetical protein
VAVTSIPPTLCGVWQRESLSLAGGEPREDSRVVWLQTTGGGFADVRVPIGERGQAVAFAGYAEWSAPKMTFHHVLDLDLPGSPDVGTLELDGDRLTESGEFALDGKSLRYQEIWARQDPGKHQTWQLDGVSESVVGDSRPLAARLVRVGDHAILISFDAVYLRLDSASYWIRTWGVSPGPYPPLPAEWPRSVGATLEVESSGPGWGATTWSVRSAA